MRTDNAAAGLHWEQAHDARAVVVLSLMWDNRYAAAGLHWEQVHDARAVVVLSLMWHANNVAVDASARRTVLSSMSCCYLWLTTRAVISFSLPLSIHYSPCFITPPGAGTLS